MKKNNIFMLILLFIAIQPYSHAESLMRIFSHCDAEFFQNIDKTPNLKNVSTVLKKRKTNKHEPIAVDIDYTSTGKLVFNKFIVSHTDFDQYDDFTYMGMKGQYYFWGFETNQSLEKVIAYTSKRISIIKVGNSYIYSPMIRNDLNDDWVFNKLAAGSYNLEPNAAEKMMIIEPDERRGVVRFLCTLQGNVTAEDLKFVGLE